MTFSRAMRKQPPKPGSRAHALWLAFQELPPQEQAAVGDMALALMSEVPSVGPHAALEITYAVARLARLARQQGA